VTSQNLQNKGNGVAGSAARIFVALKIAPSIARDLAEMARELERLPVHLNAPNDIHLTLVPPWNETSIPTAIAKLRGVTEKVSPFNLAFVHLNYGPQARHPRLLWVECTASRELMELHAALVLAFGQNDDRPFHPHVTLARLRGNGTAIARKRPIDRPLAFVQWAETVELMQSPRPSEAGYRMLASLQLKGVAIPAAVHDKTNRPGDASLM